MDSENREHSVNGSSPHGNTLLTGSQRKTAWLVRADRKSMIPKMTTLNNCVRTVCQSLKQMGYSSQQTQWAPLLSAKNSNLRLQGATAQQYWTTDIINLDFCWSWEFGICNSNRSTPHALSPLLRPIWRLFNADVNVLFLPIKQKNRVWKPWPPLLVLLSS